MNITTKHGNFERDCELYLVVAFHTFFFVSDSSLWLALCGEATAKCPGLPWALTHCPEHNHRNWLSSGAVITHINLLLFPPKCCATQKQSIPICALLTVTVAVNLTLGSGLKCLLGPLSSLFHVCLSLTYWSQSHCPQEWKLRFRACIFDIAQETYRRNSYY